MYYLLICETREYMKMFNFVSIGTIVLKLKS